MTLMNAIQSSLLQQQAMIVVSARKNRMNQKKRKQKWMKRSRLNWDAFHATWDDTPSFERAIRMTKDSFTKLVDLLKEDLEVDRSQAARRGGHISPQICVYVTLRWLAGGSYLDIHMHTGISKTALYNARDKTLRAINHCQQLDIKGIPSTKEDCANLAEGFMRKSTGMAIKNCVGAVDGYLMRITTPSKKETDNIRSFFSGHYQCYGVNIQGVCDSECRFLHLCITGPGVMHDRAAFAEKINGVSLKEIVEQLPMGYVIVADCAYEASENVTPIYAGNDARNKDYDNWNYYASQLRIRIEMAFGLMQQKWQILKAPLQIDLKNMKHVVGAICRLHNFIIDERTDDLILQEASEIVDEAHRQQQDLYRQPGVFNERTGEILSDPLNDNLVGLPRLPGQSAIRERMVERTKNLGLVRPLQNRINFS